MRDHFFRLLFAGDRLADQSEAFVVDELVDAVAGSVAVGVFVVLVLADADFDFSCDADI